MRALHFLLADVAGRVDPLEHGLAMMLTLMDVKMLNAASHPATVAVLVGASVIASAGATRGQPQERDRRGAPA